MLIFWTHVMEKQECEEVSDGTRGQLNIFNTFWIEVS